MCSEDHREKLAADEIAKVHEREKKARDEAVEANRSKDQFLAFVSHELRSPLNAILGWAKILLSKDVGEEKRRYALEIIERSARGQTKLIDDLVDGQRASGKLRPNQRQPIYYIVRNLSGLKPTAEAKRRSEFRSDKEVFSMGSTRSSRFWKLIKCDQVHFRWRTGAREIVTADDSVRVWCRTGMD